MKQQNAARADGSSDLSALNNYYAAEKPLEREYRVRPVLRYVVTEFTGNNLVGNVRELGEYPNEEIAWTVASGIARANGAHASIHVQATRDMIAKLTDSLPVKDD